MLSGANNPRLMLLGSSFFLLLISCAGPHLSVTRFRVCMLQLLGTYSVSVLSLLSVHLQTHDDDEPGAAVTTGSFAQKSL